MEEQVTELPSIVKMRRFLKICGQYFMLCSAALYLVCFVVFWQVPAIFDIETGKLLSNGFITGMQTFTIALAILNVVMSGYELLDHSRHAFRQKRRVKAVLFTALFILWLVFVGFLQTGYLTYPPTTTGGVLAISVFITIAAIVSLASYRWYSQQILMPTKQEGTAHVEVEQSEAINLCQVCKQRKIIDVKHSICKTCQKAYQNYIQQINAQLYRAKSHGLPATLTLPQWLEKLQHFGNHCAYCQVNSIEVIEHYIPISQGGGTTDENCLPACRSCNSQKTDKHPEK